MKLFSFSPDEALVAVRAMLTCARADGEIKPSEADLAATAAAMFGLPATVPAELPSVGPDEIRAAFPSAKGRERVLQTMILMALMDGDVTGAEVELVAEYARALEVPEPRVENLRQISEGRLRTLWLDLARRSFARPIFEQTLKDKGLRGVWKIVGPMLGLAKDPDLAGRYIALGHLPDGTFGKAYFRFIVDNDLGFPGEGVVAEEGMWHDLTHVLAGYDTSPSGEVSVVSFIAGYAQEDPFFWLFTIALQFHLKIRVSPYSTGERGYFDPAIVLPALKRGMAVRRDISRAWDPWPELGRPLEDVRRELGVAP